MQERKSQRTYLHSTRCLLTSILNKSLFSSHLTSRPKNLGKASSHIPTLQQVVLSTHR